MSLSMLNMIFVPMMFLISETPQIEQSFQDLNGYRLAALDVTGATDFPRKKLIAEFPIRIGDAFIPSRINKGIDRIKNLFEEAGYLDFKLTQSIDIDGKAKTVAVSFNIWQGEQYRINQIRIMGPFSMSDRKARKIIADSKIEECKPFNLNRLKEAARKLDKALKAEGLSLRSSEFTTSISEERKYSTPSGLVDICFIIQEKTP
jgi:outer membrane protein assembly factor BamA